jgi:hypothetical protein
MKLRIAAVIVLALMAALVLVPAAQAGVSQQTINAIINDASDGHIDGNWTKAQVQAALNYIRNNPTVNAYSNTEGVLEAFLSGSEPATGTGNLSFTGSNLVLAFGAGIGLIAGGLLLRRRLAAGRG